MYVDMNEYNYVCIYVCMNLMCQTDEIIFILELKTTFKKACLI